MNEMLVLIFGIIGLIFALVIIHARRSVAYVYSSATISAWEARLLSEARLMEMADAPGVDNLLASLDDTEYRPLLTEVAKGGQVDMEKVEIAFKENLNSRFLELLKIVPKERRETIRRMLQRSEVWNLKMIVTAIHNGTSIEDSLKRHMISPAMTSERLEMLTSVKSFEQLLEFLKGSEYYTVLLKALKEYRERGLIALLSALDSYYYTSLWEEVHRIKSQRSILMSMVGCEIDIVNIKLILRLKQEGAAPDEIDRYLIRPSHMLTEGMLRAMVYAENIRSALDAISGTLFGRVLLDVFSQIEARGLFIAERTLDELRLKVFRQQSITHLFSVAPAVSYIQFKENEVRNLLALIRLKAEKVEPQKIKEKIVRVPKIEF